MNQCDGCRAKMPIKDGLHYNHKDEIHMVCTAKEYGHKPVIVSGTLANAVADGFAMWLRENGFLRR